MDKSTTIKRYAACYDVLQRLGEISLFSTPKQDDLDLPRGVMQACYKDIKEYRLDDLSLIDYLCLISTNYLLLEWEKTFPEIKEKTLKGIPEITDKLIHNTVISTEDFSIYNLPSEEFASICSKNTNDYNNATRLFLKNATYFLNSSQHKEIYFFCLETLEEIKKMICEKVGNNTLKYDSFFDGVKIGLLKKISHDFYLKHLHQFCSLDNGEIKVNFNG